MERSLKNRAEQIEKDAGITAEIILNDGGLMTSKSSHIVEMQSDSALLLFDSALDAGQQITLCLSGAADVLNRVFGLDTDGSEKATVIITQAEVVSASRNTEVNDLWLISLKLIGNVRIQRTRIPGVRRAR